MDGRLPTVPRLRPPAVAGLFYPDDPRALTAAVRGYLAAARGAAAGRGAVAVRPRALVAPHAGYVYSGPVAGSAFASLTGATWVRRVLLLGPSHYVPFAGLALPDAEAFLTPLGEVPLDAEGIAALSGLPQVERFDAAHRREHALEVELPFLQLLLPGLAIVPLVVGEAGVEEVAQVVERLAALDGTLVVVSTDLSHYLDYEAAERQDAATSAAIEAGAFARIGDSDACGARPLRGLLAWAVAEGLTLRCLDLRNSGDTAGPRDRVVGYGAYVAL